MPETGWLKAIGIYSFRVLEAGSVESRCHQGHIVSKRPGEESFLAFSSLWWLPATYGAILLSASIFTWSPPLCICVQISSMTLTYLHLQRSFSQMRSYLQVPGLKTSMCILGRHRKPTTFLYEILSWLRYRCVFNRNKEYRRIISFDRPDVKLNFRYTEFKL